MDVTEIGKKLGLSESKHVIRKAAKLHRLCDFQFDCSAIGIGETCMAVICLEIAATRYKDQFLKSLPATRRASADFTRPVFTAVAFYLCAKKHRRVEDYSFIEAEEKHYRHSVVRRLRGVLRRLTSLLRWLTSMLRKPKGGLKTFKRRFVAAGLGGNAGLFEDFQLWLFPKITSS
ncbi:hypothetical protein Vadar_033790 [Vaccinium darrowii]|uniref:Uncharacterized protein n=1 Tax=Vaccinium darrowii TaxID=229202 RepID=A0ACB7XE38_9ERIC|nr:hypothetical protein Vadar_033790 [Vaccinium darrowii]